MIKVSVMYPNTPGACFDHAYYRDKHKHIDALHARQRDRRDRCQPGGRMSDNVDLHWRR